MNFVVDVSTTHRAVFSLCGYKMEMRFVLVRKFMAHGVKVAAVPFCSIPRGSHCAFSAVAL